jgi:hypothetical protein
METWTFGPFACELYAMFESQFGCVSIWTMTMIAFDRYNVIVKPMKILKPAKDPRYLGICPILDPRPNVRMESNVVTHSLKTQNAIIYTYSFILQAVSANEKKMRDHYNIFKCGLEEKRFLLPN